jgi:YHS domain-containing protein
MLLKKFALALTCGLLSLAAWAAGPVNTSKDGVAVKGYDPVAYFVDNKPVPGKPEFMAKANGATYLFATAENRDKFTANPGQYQPQYGGYCSYGVAQGYKPDIDPTAFKVVDGKLFLNLSPEVSRRWQLDIPGYIKSANENWTTLADK